MARRSRRSEQDEVLVRAFGTRLREMRTQQGLTQERLADLAGVTAAEVGFIERGEREPGLVMMARLAAGLDRSLGDLASI